VSAPTYTPYVEPPKPAQKMSFYSEEYGAKVARIPNATERQCTAARRVLAQQPDSDALTLMIFGAEK
jgi:hypothetical protein